MTHLFIALSGHGFGHLAQVAPVVAELRRQSPHLRLTMQSPLAASVLRRRIDGEFTHLPEATDFGMVMSSALDVIRDESWAAYQRFHADWETRLARQIALFDERRPALLLADVPYLPLAAAAHLGIPAVALCSLHWADILPAYYADSAELRAWRAVMLAAYNSAAAFLRPAPSMPMPDLTNTRPIGPIAAIGQDRRGELDRLFGLRGDEKLVLVALGGIDLDLPLSEWPTAADVRWLVPPNWPARRADLLNWGSAMPFVDLVRSCDVVLTKPGYGSFTEAVCNGRPVLHVERADWPESVWLIRWLERHGNAVAITRRQLETGAFMPALRDLLAQPRKPPVPPTGIHEAATFLGTFLNGPGRR